MNPQNTEKLFGDEFESELKRRGQWQAYQEQLPRIADPERLKRDTARTAAFMDLGYKLPQINAGIAEQKVAQHLKLEPGYTPEMFDQRFTSYIGKLAQKERDTETVFRKELDRMANPDAPLEVYTDPKFIGYQEQAKAMIDSLAPDVRDFLKTVNKAATGSNSMMFGGTEEEDASLGNVITAWRLMDDEQRQQARELLPLVVGPAVERAPAMDYGFWKDAYLGVQENREAMAFGIATFGEDVTWKVGDLISSLGVVPELVARKTKLNPGSERIESNLQERELMAILRNVRSSFRDKRVEKDGFDFSKLASMFGSTVAEMGSSAMMGPAFIAAKEGEYTLDDMVSNPDANPAFRRLRGAAYGYLYKKSEDIQLKMLAPKLRGGFLRNTLKRTTGELFQEGVQESIQPAIDAISANLDKGITPTTKQEWVDRLKALGEPESVGMFLLMSAAASGVEIGNNAVQSRSFAEQSKSTDILQVMGVRKEDADAIAQIADPKERYLRMRELQEAGKIDKEPKVDDATHGRAMREARRIAGDEVASDGATPLISRLKDGNLRVDMPDGTGVTVADPEAALAASRNWVQQNVMDKQDQAAALLNLAKEKGGVMGALREAEQMRLGEAHKGLTQESMQRLALSDAISQGVMTPAMAETRIRDLAYQEAAELEAKGKQVDPEVLAQQYVDSFHEGKKEFYVQGQAAGGAKIENGMLIGAMRIADGASVEVVWEEALETHIKAMMNSGYLLEDELRQWIQDVEAKTGKSFLAGDKRSNLVEAFSYIGKAYAAGEIKADRARGPLLQKIQKLLDILMQMVGMAKEIQGLRDSGQLDPDLEANIRAGLGYEGTNEFYNNLVKKAQNSQGAAHPPAMPDTHAVVSIEKMVAEMQGMELRARTEEEFFGKIWPSIAKKVGTVLKPTSRNAMLAAKAALADIQQFMKDNPHFLGYYSADWNASLNILKGRIQGFQDDDIWLYRLMSGACSPSTGLSQNTNEALRILVGLYNGHQINDLIGVVESDKGNASVDRSKPANPGGLPAPNKVRAILGAFEMKQKWGLSWRELRDKLGEYITPEQMLAERQELGYSALPMSQKAMVDMLEAAGQKVQYTKNSKGKKTPLVPRVILFGPKVGPYIANNLGYSDLTTVDIWESRFIRTYFGMWDNTGIPATSAERELFGKFSQAFHKAFAEQHGPQDQASLQALRWFFMIEACRRCGWDKGKTSETISHYTQVHLDKLMMFQGIGKTADTAPATDAKGDTTASLMTAEQLHQVAIENPEGFTINPRTGKMLDSGVVVAPRKATEYFATSETAEGMQEFLAKWGGVLAGNDEAYMGGWLRSADGKFVLDVVTTYDTREEAIAVAVKADQDAVFDLNTFDEIKRDRYDEYAWKDAKPADKVDFEKTFSLQAPNFKATDGVVRGLAEDEIAHFVTAATPARISHIKAQTPGGRGEELKTYKNDPELYCKRGYIGLNGYTVESHLGIDPSRGYRIQVHPSWWYDTANDPLDLTGEATEILTGKRPFKANGVKFFGSAGRDADTKAKREIMMHLIRDRGYLGFLMRGDSVGVIVQNLPVDGGKFKKPRVDTRAQLKRQAEVDERATQFVPQFKTKAEAQAKVDELFAQGRQMRAFMLLDKVKNGTWNEVEDGSFSLIPEKIPEKFPIELRQAAITDYVKAPGFDVEIAAMGGLSGIGGHLDAVFADDWDIQVQKAHRNAVYKAFEKSREALRKFAGGNWIDVYRIFHPKDQNTGQATLSTFMTRAGAERAAEQMRYSNASIIKHHVHIDDVVAVFSDMAGERESIVIFNRAHRSTAFPETLYQPGDDQATWNVTADVDPYLVQFDKGGEMLVSRTYAGGGSVEAKVSMSDIVVEWIQAGPTARGERILRELQSRFPNQELYVSGAVPSAEGFYQKMLKRGVIKGYTRWNTAANKADTELVTYAITVVGKHGTARTFRRFDPKLAGSNFEGRVSYYARRGIHFTTDDFTARMFADKAAAVQFEDFGIDNPQRQILTAEIKLENPLTEETFLSEWAQQIRDEDGPLWAETPAGIIRDWEQWVNTGEDPNGTFEDLDHRSPADQDFGLYRLWNEHIGGSEIGLYDTLNDAIWEHMDSNGYDGIVWNELIVVDNPDAIKITDRDTFNLVNERDLEFVKPKRADKDTEVLVDLNKFVADWEAGGFAPIQHGGEGGIGQRYAKFGEWIQKGEPIEMPEVSLGVGEYPGFTNGRHRTRWLYDHGVRFMPMAVATDENLQRFREKYEAGYTPEPTFSVQRSKPAKDYEKGGLEVIKKARAAGFTVERVLWHGSPLWTGQGTPGGFTSFRTGARKNHEWSVSTGKAIHFQVTESRESEMYARDPRRDGKEAGHMREEDFSDGWARPFWVKGPLVGYRRRWRDKPSADGMYAGQEEYVELYNPDDGKPISIPGFNPMAIDVEVVTDDVVKALTDAGYSGILYQFIPSFTEAAIFDPRNIKSAEIDTGVPIDQRFDTSRDDFTYSLKAVKRPKKTVKAYKLFRTMKTRPGEIFPLFMGKDIPTPIGEWVSAEIETGKIGGRALAQRPGWHAGDRPSAPHLMKKDGTYGDRVWAEVEMPADVDWQSEALRRATLKKDGTINPRTAEITDQVPHGGHYRYKTNPNMEGEWLIAGEMKVVRLLSQEEVDAIMAEGTQALSHGNRDLADRVMDKLMQEAGYTEEVWGRMLDRIYRLEARLANNKLYGVEDDGNATFEQYQDLAMYEAMLGALPAPVRGQLGGFPKLASLRTPEARYKFLREKLDLMEQHLDKFIADEARPEIKRLLEKTKPKKNPRTGVLEGKGAEFEAEMEAIRTVVGLTPDEVEQTQADLEAALATATDADVIDAITEAMIRLQAYGNILQEGKYRRHGRDMIAARNAIKELVDNGRSQYRMLMEARAEHRRQLREMAMDVITGGKGLTDSATLKKDQDPTIGKKGFKKWLAERQVNLKGLYSFHLKNQSWEWLINAASRRSGEGTLGSRLTKWASRLAHESTHQERRRNAKEGEEMARFLKQTFRIPDRADWRFLLNRRLEEFSREQEKTGVYRVEMKPTKDIEVPVKIAEKIVAGTVRPDIHGLTSYDVATLDAMLQAEAAKKPHQRKKKLSIQHRTIGPAVEQVLSQDQALYLSMLYKQEGPKAAMQRWGYDDAVMQQIDDFLTPEAKLIRDWLAAKYEANYYELNGVYSKVFGIRLPRNKNYCPGRWNHAGKSPVDNLLEEVTKGASTTPGFAKQRVNHRAEPRQDVGALQVYGEHLAQSSHFIAWAENMAELRAVFHDKYVQQALVEAGGTDLKMLVHDRLDQMANGGNTNAQAIRMLDWVRRNFTIAALSYNVGVFFKQLTSLPAFMYDMPAGAFSKLATQFWLNPVANTKEMLDNPFIKERFGGGYERDVMAVMARMNKAKGRMQWLVEGGMIFGRVGDIIPVIQGGWAIKKYTYDQAIKRGTAPADAEREAQLAMEMSVERAQQAGDVKDQSFFQSSGSIARLFTMFLTSPRQYYSNTYEALLDWRAGHQGAGKDFAKRVIVGHVILPVCFQFMVDLFSNMKNLTDDDDETGLFDLNPADYMRAILIGPLNGLFFAGHMISSGVGYSINSMIGIINSIAAKKAEEANAKLPKNAKEEDKVQPVELDKVKIWGYQLPVVEFFEDLGKDTEDLTEAATELVQDPSLLAASQTVHEMGSLAKVGGGGWMAYDIAHRFARQGGMTDEIQGVFTPKEQKLEDSVKRRRKEIYEDFPGAENEKVRWNKLAAAIVEEAQKYPDIDQVKALEDQVGKAIPKKVWLRVRPSLDVPEDAE